METQHEKSSISNEANEAHKEYRKSNPIQKKTKNYNTYLNRPKQITKQLSLK